MRDQASNRLAFFFDDARCQYSARQIEDLVASGVTDANAIVHTISLPLRAGDVSQGKTLTLHDILSSEFAAEAMVSDCLNEAVIDCTNLP